MTSSDISAEHSVAPAEGSEIKQQIVITDRKAGRAWSGEGATIGEAATGAVRKLLDDRRAKEYLS